MPVKPAYIVPKQVSIKMRSHQPDGFQMNNRGHFAGPYLSDWCVENSIRTILVKQTLRYLQRTPTKKSFSANSTSKSIFSCHTEIEVITIPKKITDLVCSLVLANLRHKKQLLEQKKTERNCNNFSNRWYLFSHQENRRICRHFLI